jgi:multidrug efflux pump subunit AcrB
LEDSTPSAPDRERHRLRVAVRYPGASVQVVDSTVAVPLLKELDGVEGVTRIESESAGDGTCTIAVWLDPKADPVKVEDLVRKRVTRAETTLPKECDRKGISVRTEPARPAEFWFALTDTNDRDETGWPAALANYARKTYRDALRRVPGVSEVRVLPATTFAGRVRLEPDKMRALQVSVDEIRAALQAALHPAASPRLSQAKEYVLTFVSPIYPTKWSEIVIKETEGGRKIVLGDVAKVELGATFVDAFTTFDGRPAVLIAVTADRDAAPEALERTIAALRKEDPPGVGWAAAVTPATPRVLRLDVEVPPGSTPEYTHAKCGEVEKLVLAWNGGLPAVTYTGNGPLSHVGTIRVPCKPDADADALRKRLTGERAIPNAVVRIGDVTGGEPAFPVRVALVGPDAERLRNWSGAVLAGARKAGIVSDATDWPDRGGVGQELVFDTDVAARKGVSVAKALDTLNILVGGTYEDGLVRPNQFSKVFLPAAPDFRRVPEDLGNLFVKNDKGELVPYSAFMTVKRTAVPASIYRLGPERALRITANAAAGKSVADCAAKLRELAEGEQTGLKLTTGYRAVVLAP